MSMKTIGILLKKPENSFSNGCVQQVLFLEKLFKNAGYNVDFLSVEADYTEFELTGNPVIVTNAQSDFSKYHCILLGSLVLTYEGTNIPYINNLVSYKVPIINLICGNVFILHQEEFVFDTHHIIANYIQDYVTEYWVMEMYDYSIDYVRMLSGKPTRLVPYTWDIDIIKSYIEKNDVFKTPDRTIDNTKINLLLFEPNMSIHKNALVPLLICEEYYRQNPDRVNKIYAFCSDKIKETLNPKFLQHLSIVRDSKLEMYGRIIMPYIVDVIEKNNPFLNVVVSYNLLNRLNFLHLEMFYLGIPIVHNCEPFKDNGYHFNDFELMNAVTKIELARTTFNKKDYLAQCRTHIIDEFSTSNTKRIQDYQKLIESVNTTTKDIQIEAEPKNKIIVEAKQQSTSKRFLQGEGYVSVINTEEDVTNVLAKLQQLSTTSPNIVQVELFVYKPIDISRIIEFKHRNITKVKITVLESEENIHIDQASERSSYKSTSTL